MSVDVAILLFLLILGSAVSPILAPRLGVPEAVLQILRGCDQVDSVPFPAPIHLQHKRK